MIFRRILLIGFALNLSFFGSFTKGHREWQKKLLSMISGWNKRKIIIWEVCSCGTGSCIISPTKCFPNWMVACGDNMGNLWRNENHIRTRRKKMYNRLIFLFSVWLWMLFVLYNKPNVEVDTMALFSFHNFTNFLININTIEYSTNFQVDIELIWNWLLKIRISFLHVFRVSLSCHLFYSNQDNARKFVFWLLLVFRSEWYFVSACDSQVRCGGR